LRRIVSATICPMNWTQIVSAISALMIVVRVKNVAIAVTAPITSSEMWGKRSVWCSLPKGRKNMPSRAALNGSREAPSRPV
jgi:hypothetical protein